MLRAVQIAGVEPVSAEYPPGSRPRTTYARRASVDYGMRGIAPTREWAADPPSIAESWNRLRVSRAGGTGGSSAVPGRQGGLAARSATNPLCVAAAS